MIYLSLIFTMLLWGGTFIAGRLLAGEVAPASSAFLRFFIATLSLALLVMLAERRLILPPKRLWLPLTLLGLTGIFFYNVFFFSGLQYISASRAALFIACTPLAISLGTVLFMGERLGPLQILGIIISLAGAFIVISNGQPELLFHGGFGKGELSLLGCVFSWTAYSLIGRSVLSVLPPLRAVFYSSAIGTLLLLPLALASGLAASLWSVSGNAWGCLTYLGVGGTALGFSFYYQGITRIGASRAGIFINLVPVFALILAWLILDESLQPSVLLGGLLVLGGVSLSNYAGHRAQVSLKSQSQP